jgi:hypothetical protein
VINREDTAVDTLSIWPDQPNLVEVLSWQWRQAINDQHTSRPLGIDIDSPSDRSSTVGLSKEWR